MSVIALLIIGCLTLVKVNAPIISQQVVVIISIRVSKVHSMINYDKSTVWNLGSAKDIFHSHTTNAINKKKHRGQCSVS